MKTLYILTLEPIEKRYTKQWYKYWKQEFSKKFKVIYIDGEMLGDKIIKGKFLDINKTNIWKAQQIEKVARLFMQNKINNTDIFLFADAWHFGVTAIKYMIQLNKMKCKMYGFWHAGTYDPYDFITQAGLKQWARYDELAWFNVLDGSFVATQFHKDLISNAFERINIDKIHVVGFPMDWKQMIKNEGVKINVPKENIVVFPHRLDKEKCPEVFDELAKHFKNFKFIKTMEVTKNKKEYYQLLAKAKVMFSASQQETYGIGTVESVMFNVLPIVPNGLSYKEMYYDIFRYNDAKDALFKMYIFTKNPYPVYIQQQLEINKKLLIKNSLQAIPKMAKIMGAI